MELQKCDVGIVDGQWFNPMTWFILNRTSTPHTHAFLVFSPVKAGIIDPTFPRLTLTTIDHYKGRTVHILRPRELDFVTRERILLWALAEYKAGRRYDFLSWLGFISGLKQANDKDAWFCSEFVDACFTRNGFPLWCERPAFVYPSDLTQNPRFEYLGIYGKE